MPRPGHVSPTCEAVYYNECDETPHKLLLCPVDVSFEADALDAGCPFRMIESFDKVRGDPHPDPNPNPGHSPNPSGYLNRDRNPNPTLR